jgi:hypothetical protein
MDFIVFQKIAVKNELNLSETLVFSLMKSFGNFLSMSELISYLEIQTESLIKKSIKSLLEKELIECVMINRIKHYKITK